MELKKERERKDTVTFTLNFLFDLGRKGFGGSGKTLTSHFHSQSKQRKIVAFHPIFLLQFKYTRSVVIQLT